MSATSTGWCGTSWAPSTRNSAPTEWASSPISRSGGITPVTFDCPVTATILVRSVTSDGSTSRRPSGSSLNHLSVAPVRSASCCHGTRLAWCSISEMTISSPGLQRPGEPERDQVDPLGRRLGEHDLVRRGGAEERGDLGPGALVDLGGLLAEQVGAAVRGGVVPLVVLPLGVEHDGRVLRGRPGVQVDQRLAVPHGPGQDREVLPDRLDVERDRPDGHPLMPPRPLP